jgi:hypothetical protein
MLLTQSTNIFNLNFSHFFRRRVIFLNTDQVPALETRSGEVLRNDIEGSLVTMVTRYH